MPAATKVPCHCQLCRGALVGRSTARQHTAKDRKLDSGPLVPSVTQWLTQNAGTSADARLDDRDQVEAESDGEGVGNRPFKRTRFIEHDVCNYLNIKSTFFQLYGFLPHAKAEENIGFDLRCQSNEFEDLDNQNDTVRTDEKINTEDSEFDVCVDVIF